MWLGLGLRLAPASIRTLVYNIAAQFVPALPGLWHDPSDYASLSQDSAGTSSVTAVTQPAGLMLDKRLGLVLGPQLNSNPGPFTATTGYTASNATLTIDAARIKCAVTGAAAGVDVRMPTVVGKWYQVNLAGTNGDATGPYWLVNSLGGLNITAPITTTVVRFQAVAVQSLVQLILGSGGLGSFAFIESISVKLLDGNHLSQSTAAARPVTNARVNLLTKTENFADGAWVAFGATVSTPNFGADPDGATTACRLQFSSAAAQFYQIVPNFFGVSAAQEWYVKSNTGANQTFRIKNSAPDAYSADLIATNVWQRFTHVSVASNSGAHSIAGNSTGAAADILVWHPSFANAATRYQRVNTTTDYDTVGFPKFVTLDGVDDGFSNSMAFSADMDFFILYRRASANPFLLANFGTGAFFGVAQVQDVSPDTAASAGGSVTYAVNGVPLNGGLPPTRTQLNSAVPVGAWVVIEVRNLNLLANAWPGLNIGNYAGFTLNGDIGGIIMAPAGNAETRQSNRRELGNKAGLILP